MGDFSLQEAADAGMKSQQEAHVRLRQSFETAMSDITAKIEVQRVPFQTLIAADDTCCRYLLTNENSNENLRQSTMQLCIGKRWPDPGVQIGG